MGGMLREKRQDAVCGGSDCIIFYDYLWVPADLAHTPVSGG